MKVQILVRLKPGVLDVQGKAVEHGLGDLGFDGVGGVRVGRLIEMEVPATSLDQAKPQIQEMCQKLLANPIIENFEIRQG